MLRFIMNSIRTKLLAWYGALFVFVFIVSSLGTHFLVREIIESGIESELKNSTSTVRTMIRASAEISIRNHLRGIAWRNNEIVKYFHRQYLDGKLTEQEAQKKAREVLFSQRIGKTGYIYCVNSAGVAVVHRDPGVEGHNFSYRFFVQEQIKRKEGYLTYDWRNPGELTPRPKALYMTYFQPWDWIISVSSYREEFADLINVDDFRESILSLRFGRSGYSFLLNGKGEIIIHPSYKGDISKLEDAQLRSTAQKIISQKTGKIIYDWQNPNEPEPRKKLVMLNYIPELDWIVASSGYLDEFYEPLSRIRNIIIAITLISMAIMLSMTIWISSTITHPLQSLMKLFATGATGDFSVRMEEKAQDEIGKLGHYFNTFMEELQQYSDTLRDEIKERKRSEGALRESEERFRSLTENSPDIIISIGQDGYITYVNPVIEAILGYRRDELIGKEFLFLVREEDKADFISNYKKVRDHEENLLDYNGVLLHKDGTQRYFIICGTPITNYQGQVTGVESVLKDVTERKELETQLQQIQRIEAVGTLAGGIAHDFNNILTAIRGSLDLCMLTIPEESPVRKNLQLIENATVRASELTRQLLLFSRKQPMKSVAINLNSSVASILTIVERLIGEDIAVQIDLEPELWSVMADKGSVEQIIMNLIINARDAMPGGGVIAIKTGNAVIDEEYTRSYPYALSGEFVCLTISDNGSGMDSDTQKYIFEPFFTTKEVGKGTGLGLSVVYGIIKQHKGWITVESRPNEGSVFKTYFPAVAIKPEKEILEKVPHEELKGNGEKILIIEDDKGVLAFASAALKDSGYTVLSADTCSEASRIFSRENDNLDLIFSDVVLPDRNGLDLVEEFLKAKPLLRVLMSSGYMDEKSQTKMIQEHDYPFLPKPYNMYEMLKTVRFVLDAPAKNTKE